VARPVFSAGKVQNADWLSDFYEDSLRELDEQMANLFYELGKRGLLEKTVVIVTSDHGSKWTTDQRIPLIMYGPGIPRKRILENTQPVDVAPTLLKLLGRQPPPWMVGRSLLGAPPDPWRTIVSSEIHGHGVDWQSGRWEIQPGTSNSGLWRVGTIVCDRQTVLDLTTGEFTESTLPGTFAKCPPGVVLPAEAMLRGVVQYLAQFDFRSVTAPFVSTRAAPAPAK
jgi:hypothetical protein